MSFDQIHKEDADADLYVLRNLASDMWADWYKPTARQTLLKNFDKAKSDFDRLSDLFARMQEFKDRETANVDLRAIA